MQPRRSPGCHALRLFSLTSTFESSISARALSIVRSVLLPDQYLLGSDLPATANPSAVRMQHFRRSHIRSIAARRRRQPSAPTLLDDVRQRHGPMVGLRKQVASSQRASTTTACPQNPVRRPPAAAASPHSLVDQLDHAARLVGRSAATRCDSPDGAKRLLFLFAAPAIELPPLATAVTADITCFFSSVGLR